MTPESTPITPEVLLRHATWLRRLAYALTSDAHDAEDVAQDTLLAGLRTPPRGAGDPSAVRRWLATVARHIAWKRGRAEDARREREQLIASLSDDDAQPTRVDPRLELQRELADALFALPEALREAVVMRYFDELSGREIAARQGISEAAARQRISRGIAELRRRLDEKHPDEPLDWRASCAAWLASAPKTTPFAAVPALQLLGMGIKTKLVVVALALVAASTWWWFVSEARPSASDAHEALITAAATATSATSHSDSPTLDATAPDSTRTTIAATNAPPAAPRVFDRENELFGVVFDPDGHPLAGARVVALEKETGAFTWFDAERTFAKVARATDRTDANGEFAMRLPLGTPFELEVDHERFARAFLASRYAGERVEVHLERAARIAGRVVRKDDRSPLAGTSVRGFPAADGSLSAPPMVELFRVEADDEGRFEVARLAPGTIMLLLEPPHAQVSPTGVTLVAGETAEPTFEVEAGLTVRGRVTDADTDAPIAGAEVRFGNDFMRAARTDAQGEYVLEGVSPQWPAVEATAAGYGRRSAPIVDEQRHARERVDIALARGITVTGRAVDRNGAGVDGAYVAAIAFPTMSLEHEWRAVRTLSDGKFEIADVRRDLELWLLVHRAGFATSTYTLPAIEAGARKVDLGDVELATGALVTGRVVDERGNAVANWPVELNGVNASVRRYVDPKSSATQAAATLASLSPTERTAHLDAYFMSSGVSFFAARRNGRSDDLGRFRFADVAPGLYRLELASPGGMRDGPRCEFLVEAEREPEPVVLTARSNLAIEGRVVDDAGAPVEGASLTAAPESTDGDSGTRAHAMTTANGAFRLDGLAAGTYRVRANGPKRAAGDAAGPSLAYTFVEGVHAGEPSLEIAVPRRASIVGRVLDAGGAPCAGVPVCALDSRGRIARFGPTDAAGRFELPVRVDDPYDIVASRTLELPRDRDTLPPDDGTRVTAFGARAVAQELDLRLK